MKKQSPQGNVGDSRAAWPSPSPWEQALAKRPTEPEPCDIPEKEATLAAIREMSADELADTWIAVILAERIAHAGHWVTPVDVGVLVRGQDFVSLMENLAVNQAEGVSQSDPVVSIEAWFRIVERLLAHPHPLVRCAAAYPLFALLRSSEPARALDLFQQLYSDPDKRVSGAADEYLGNTTVPDHLAPLDYFRFWRDYVKHILAEEPTFLGCDIAGEFN